ncbi:MAG: hypothetical protein U9O96_05205 [Candidatus Thermoplasmatota archaeon]|nr:hypothetical protein [Candidatus Thermoplasmatota archaeon]
MQYHIPSGEEIVVAIYKALKKHGTIDSQKKMRDMVMEELEVLDKKYRVSPQRVRKLAVRAGFIRMEIKSREGEGELVRCPVCNSKLKKIKNFSLWGKEVIIGYRCTVCNYKSGVKRQVPTRYIFHLNEGAKRGNDNDGQL